MKKRLISMLLAGSMALVMNAAVALAEDADVNEDGTVNNPEAVEVDDNKLVFWSLFSGGDGEWMDKIISDYNEGKPTKEVQSIMLVWADYYTKLQTAVAADKGPDIGISHAYKLPELVDSGVVQPITGYLDDLGIDLSTMYSENSLNSVTFDGEIYAVPLDVHGMICYYNKDILAEAGVELNADGKLDIEGKDQFLEICDKVKNVLGDGETVISLPSQGDQPYRVWYATYFQMGGSKMLSEDGTEVTLDQDIAIEAAEFVKSLYDDGYIAEGIDDMQKLFSSGKAAFMFGNTGALGAFESTEGLNFDARTFPQLFEEDHCYADSHTLVLPVSSTRSEEDSKAAVEFMVSASRDGGVTWAGAGQIPANLDVLESQEYLDLPYRSNYKDEVNKAVFAPKNPHFGTMKDEMVQSLDNLWIGASDAGTVVDAVYDALESNLD